MGDLSLAVQCGHMHDDVPAWKARSWYNADCASARLPAGVRDPIDGARHSLIGLHQYYAHNCTHDVHGAGGEAQLGACRIEYEIQPKERDPEAASCRQFCHLTAAHTDFLSYAGRE